jgi:uncharacterized protein YdcH (DUF465 family)
MIERILLRKLRERLSDLMALCDRVYEEWYRKCEENLKRGGSSLNWYGELLEDIQKKASGFLSLMEKLAKLDKEISNVDVVDETVRTLAYGIVTELSEEERKEVIEFLQGILQKRRKEDAESEDF